MDRGQPVVDSALALIHAWRDRRALAVEAFRATLAGTTGVNVQVEPLNADAERDGLTSADLRADVESTLRAAGIGILSQAELFLEPGTPFLHLDVMTIRLDGRYAYSVRLELWQAVRLVGDPSVQTLAVTWSRPQLVGTVSAERLIEIRSAVRAAVDAFVGDVASGAFNLLVSSSWRGHGAAKREIRELLAALGDERPTVERTVAKGITGVRTSLEPRRVVREFRAIFEQDPGRFQFTCKWVPIDTWTHSDLESLTQAVMQLKHRIQPGETWRMTVEKRRYAGHHRAEVIAELAALIDEKVNLTAPDKILRIDLVGENAGVSVLAPDDIFSVMRPRRPTG